MLGGLALRILGLGEAHTKVQCANVLALPPGTPHLRVDVAQSRFWYTTF